MSVVSRPVGYLERVRRWLPTSRPPFRAGSRLAQVGLLGRSIDTVSRLSLLVRGAVPGGSAGAALQLQREHLAPDRPTVYARVVQDGPWIVCQYWFFYAFNNWRSGFSGVNEHEGDWEQVTVYLDGTAEDDDGLPPARWVVFSAHDETGDDLRRRWDDPDLMTYAGRHPVVFAGAGSHSGAYLPGDYLITIVPPSWGGVVPMVRRLARLFTPWTRAAQGSGLSIPYLDYARGDGLGIGPGEELGWVTVVIDDDTPWVRDYRGLWGHDTHDALGGERGPAGPRYERDGRVRASWGDPVGWAGLGKVAPNSDAERGLLERRLQRIDVEIAHLDDEVACARVTLAEGAAGLAPGTPEVRALAPDEARLTGQRLESVRLRDERDRLRRAREAGLAPVEPRAHLVHRRVPIAESQRGRVRFLAAWSVVSTPLAIYLLARVLRPAPVDRPTLAIAALLMVLSIEAFARGYFIAYLARLAVVLVLVSAVPYLENWQVVYWSLVAAAVAVLAVNLRDVLRR